MQKIASLNPSKNYEIIGEIEIDNEESIKEKIEISKIAQKKWEKLEIKERIEICRDLYNRIKQKKEELAKSISKEMGMPIKESIDEVQYGLNYFNWYLNNADKYLSSEITFENETEIHKVFYEAKGLVVAIAPWNYPSFMFIWTCIQAILAGNSVIFKTSKEVILTGKIISDIVESSSLPKGVWIEVFGDGKIGDILINQEIDFITFTGSTDIGKKISKLANEKGIGCVLELGGSAPGIICADANIDSILGSLYFMRFSNCGQMCDGLKRLIVHESKYEELKEKLIKMLNLKKVGIAELEETDIGPLVSESQLNYLNSQYEDAINKGAKIVFKLNVDKNLYGAYFSPTILENISYDMKIWNEEVFGPILPIIKFKTIDEAITIANDTIYGLGGYIFTESSDNFLKIAKEIKTGMVQMNNINYCIPENPFGGYKNSGIGREHGKWGFYEFTNIKTISMPK